jgi:hypothetical protein
MLAQNSHIPAIGAKGDVEQIAENRHRADDPVDRDIADHADEDAPRRAQQVRLIKNVSRERRRHAIADTGRKPDQRVRAEADIRAGNDKAVSKSVASRSNRSMRSRRECE